MMLSNTRYTNAGPGRSPRSSTARAENAAANKSSGLIQPGSVTHGLRMTTPLHANGLVPGQRTNGK